VDSREIAAIECLERLPRTVGARLDGREPVRSPMQAPPALEAVRARRGFTWGRRIDNGSSRRPGG